MFIKLDHAFLLPLKGGYKFSPRLTTNYHALPRGKPLKLWKYQTLSIMTLPKMVGLKVFAEKNYGKMVPRIEKWEIFSSKFFFEIFLWNFFKTPHFSKILPEKTFKITISTRKTKAMKSIKTYFLATWCRLYFKSSFLDIKTNECFHFDLEPSQFDLLLTFELSILFNKKLFLNFNFKVAQKQNRVFWGLMRSIEIYFKTFFQKQFNYCVIWKTERPRKI